MNETFEEAVHRAQVGKRRPTDRRIYIRSDNSGGFGRQMARDLFEKHVRKGGDKAAERR